MYGSKGGEWGSGHPTYTDKHTHMRTRVLADYRDVGLPRNTGIPQKLEVLCSSHPLKNALRQR